MSQVNPASDLLNQIWQQELDAETLRPAKPDAEARAEVTRNATNASAFRGLAFGLPLALVIWSLPMIAWLATGNPWLGALAAVCEFTLAAWFFWSTRSPIHTGGPR